jgi:predicted ArsR family transcriptional regulator
MTYRETSREAHESIKDQVPTIQERILSAIKSSGGKACFEIEAELELTHQTASAAMSGMNKKGSIVDSGKRRKTASGRNAIVWQVPTPPQEKGGQGLLFGSSRNAMTGNVSFE